MLIYRRDPRTPTSYRFVLLGIVAMALLEALSGIMQNPVRMIGYCVFWFLYWCYSERVRLTFAPASGMMEIPKTP